MNNKINYASIWKKGETSTGGKFPKIFVKYPPFQLHTQQ